MSDDKKQAVVQGSYVYDRMALKGFWQSLIRQLRGKPVQLLSYDDLRVRLHLREGSYLGLQDIPLANIVGSVGRYRDFTATFLPTMTVSTHRWSSVYAEMTDGNGLPPIEVFRVNDSFHHLYFVRDGNHRVSVARALKFETIQAYVIDVSTSVCLELLMKTGSISETEAYADFLEQSQLTRLRPWHEYLFLSEPTRYLDLLEHIRLHAAVTGETAADWHDRVYLPVVEQIRQHNLLRYVRGRTEADLYVWLVEALCDLERCYAGQPGDLTPALVHFLQQHGLAGSLEVCLTDCC